MPRAQNPGLCPAHFTPYLRPTQRLSLPHTMGKVLCNCLLPTSCFICINGVLRTSTHFLCPPHRLSHASPPPFLSAMADRSRQLGAESGGVMRGGTASRQPRRRSGSTPTPGQPDGRLALCSPGPRRNIFTSYDEICGPCGAPQPLTTTPGWPRTCVGRLGADSRGRLASCPGRAPCRWCVG